MEEKGGRLAVAVRTPRGLGDAASREQAVVAVSGEGYSKRVPSSPSHQYAGQRS